MVPRFRQPADHVGESQRLSEVAKLERTLQALDRVSLHDPPLGHLREQFSERFLCEGLVVVTGCAHPGIVAMVRRARKVAGDDVALVMGGFHLGGASRDRIERVIADLRRLGVRRVGPCHCTGDQAIRMFEEAFGADFVPVGVGQTVSVGPG